jgi:hypothetical protein
MNAFDRAKRDIICAVILAQMASVATIILGVQLLRCGGFNV